MTIANIVMWETRHSTADWVCFKTQTLLEILGTQSQLQEMSCVFGEAEHFFQSVGYARNKRQFLTAPQCLKLFLWMLDFAWMGFLLFTYGHCDRGPTYNQGQHAVIQDLSRPNPTILAQGNLENKGLIN